MHINFPNIDINNYLPHIPLPHRDRITEIAKNCLNFLSALLHLSSRVLFLWFLYLGFVIKVAAFHSILMPVIIKVTLIFFGAWFFTQSLIISMHLYIPFITNKEIHLDFFRKTMVSDFLAKWIVKTNSIFGPNLDSYRNKQRETALIIAAKNGNLSFTKAFLQASNINPNLSTHNPNLTRRERVTNIARGIHSYTALMIAIEEEHFTVAVELIKSPKVNVNMSANNSERTPLDIFIDKCLYQNRRAIARERFTLTEQQFQIVSLLAEYGANNARIEEFNDGEMQFVYTVLMDAMKDGRKKARAKELEGLNPFLESLVFKDAIPKIRDLLEKMEFEDLSLKSGE